jgi:hypothetical protein
VPKSKWTAGAKTEAIPKAGIDVEPDGNQTHEQRQPCIAVDARSRKVFRALLFDPNATFSPAQIPWHDFAHAMTSSGLFSAEKLYGSVWYFRPLREECQKPILFHQPHPNGTKMSVHTATLYGRRLERVFGFAGRTFVRKVSSGFAPA